MNIIEKIRAEIESRVKSLEMPFGSQSVKEQLKEEGKLRGYKDLLSFLDTLEKEQPSLPSALHEAARAWTHNHPYSYPTEIFKGGVWWMAGQGVAKEAVIGMATEEISINVSQQTLNELDLCPGDKVIVQIRKK